MACAHEQRKVKEKEFRSQIAHLKRILGERLGFLSAQVSAQVSAVRSSFFDSARKALAPHLDYQTIET